ncbi:SMP-30/gluconolactonase/LRE family protein [Phenylobacterium montanum]|uniref:SMP-30/Gluconolactonase/LRE-like region domain-containing protein n=1 Tax=Phenylobacterium montanum TaxID=2823693 RepID=A0A975IW07_9CAUL|nr:hypothetical protein [Caulobacter sp. S6]QUD89582.1 hypothetical protein KCG34_06790 [Caulobacter sp. S6]
MMSPTLDLQALAAAAFFAAALGLLTRPRFARSALSPFPTGQLGRVILAGLALLPATVLAASMAVPFLAFFAAVLGAVITLILALYAFARGVRAIWPLPVAMLLTMALIAGLQPLGLKVMLLPKADPLPYVPVPASVVKTYGEGVWFESVRAGPDGTLYLAANIGLDFSRGDYYRRAHGEVIARKTDGSERILFTTPTGSAAGVFAVAPDGTLYMSSNGVTPGIWRITQDGHGKMLVRLPRGAWPNGLDFGPDGDLYSPDSSLGLVWRVDPRSGAAQVAVKDRSLSARPFISLAPGANGLHFKGRDMIVTVSDSTKVLSFEMDQAGKFKAPKTLASGIPGDDFAIGRDESFFITTHPYNTVVRVAPDGRRSVVADARDSIVGATDAVFGRTDADRDTLYVATDGGAFRGGTRTRGQLVALKPYARN